MATAYDDEVNHYLSLRKEAATTYTRLSLRQAAAALPGAYYSGFIALVCLLFAMLFPIGLPPFDLTQVVSPSAFAQPQGQRSWPPPAFKPPLGLSQEVFTDLVIATFALMAIIIIALLYAGFIAKEKNERAALMLERIAFLVIGAVLGTLFGIHVA